MKIRAAVSASVTLYDLVSFNDTSNQWEKASTHVGLIGSIIGIDQGATEAIISLNGNLQAYTSRAISPNGGQLNIENGQVFIDNTSGSMHRLVFPYSGDLDDNGNVPSGSLVNIVI